MGLTYTADLSASLLKGVRGMEESSTYQAILAKGEVKGEQRLLIRIGERRFGPADETVVASIKMIHDLDRLGDLASRVHLASTWAELLEGP